MASLALAPLLSMLKEMKMDIDGSSLPKKESGLFKELMELLGSENPDPKTLESLIERIETGTFKKEGSLLLSFKESDLSYPVEVKIEQKSEPQPAQKRSSPAQSLLMPNPQRGESSRDIVQKGTPVPESRVKAPKEYNRLFHARYTSHTVLKREADDAKAVHDLRSSRTLGELVRRAESFGLEVVDLSIETQKESKPSIRSETQKPQLPSSIILQHTERISQSAAEAILDSKPKSGKNMEPSAKTLTPLQSLLAESKTEEPKSRRAGGSAKIAKPGEGFSSFVSNLQSLLASPSANSRPAERNLPLQELSKQEESMEHRVKPEHILAESESVEMTLPEVRSKASEQLSQKIVDAKATLRHFAQNLQEQVQNYKPPFTRMQISLDPKELGSVEVTMVSRGNNLHIQVHSNPTAVGIMATHGNELKNQLVSMGFTDVQMQFSMNQQQQQNRQQRHNTGSGYVDREEIPDFYESLDLIVPQYV